MGPSPASSAAISATDWKALKQVTLRDAVPSLSALTTLKLSFNSLGDAGVAALAPYLKAAAATLTSSAEETSSQSASVASAAQQAAMNVQTIAASIEELSSSATEIGRQAHQSKNVAVRAVEEDEFYMLGVLMYLLALNTEASKN